MTKRKKRVFFNASVILAALHSPAGGSAKLIAWCHQGKIIGLTSEIVLDEIKRNLSKVKASRKKVKEAVLVFSIISQAPSLSLVGKYDKIVVDPGDTHILASCEDLKADYLVTLDKKHLLSLTRKIKKPEIVNPKQLIEKV